MTARRFQDQCADRVTSAHTLVAEICVSATRRRLTSTIGWDRAMPSARALLVASLLTEPPYGCLGPSGNDRYRKRSQAAGLRKSTAKSRRLFRNESAASQRVRAGAIEGSTAMTRPCRKSPQVPTGRWRDKRPQCAARSVGCLCCHFSSGPQCAASARNVRLASNSLWGFDVSHIAGPGHG